MHLHLQDNVAPATSSAPNLIGTGTERNTRRMSVAREDKDNPATMPLTRTLLGPFRHSPLGVSSHFGSRLCVVSFGVIVGPVFLGRAVLMIA